jgi:hypothetical protein
MSDAGYTVSDVTRAFADEGITLLSREDVSNHLRAAESRTILVSMTPRVMAAVCDSSAAAEEMGITSVVILGRGAQEKASAVNANVAAFYPAHDTATAERIHRALGRLANQN